MWLGDEEVSWGNRNAGHVVTTDADFTLLRRLPKGVGFQVLRHKKKPAWFIGTRSLGKNMTWPKDEDPFAEISPDGAAKFIRTVQDSAKPFCAAFDWLHARMIPHVPDIYGPSKLIGELSLGMQIATLLECPVFSYLSDPDYLAELACVNEPALVTRIRCQYGPFHLLYDGSAVESSSTINDGPAAEDFKALIKLPGVREMKKPPTSQPTELLCKELNDFVGAAIADSTDITPNLDDMAPIAQRTGSGDVKLLD